MSEKEELVAAISPVRVEEEDSTCVTLSQYLVGAGVADGAVHVTVTEVRPSCTNMTPLGGAPAAQ